MTYANVFSFLIFRGKTFIYISESDLFCDYFKSVVLFVITWFWILFLNIQFSVRFVINYVCRNQRWDLAKCVTNSATLVSVIKLVVSVTVHPIVLHNRGVNWHHSIFRMVWNCKHAIRSWVVSCCQCPVITSNVYVSHILKSSNVSEILTNMHCLVIVLGVDLTFLWLVV